VQTHGPAPPRRPARARGQNAFPKSTHSDSQRDCPWSMLRHSILDHGANSFRVASFGHTALFMVTDPDAPFRSHCMTRVVALRRRSGLPVKEAGVCRGNQFRTIFRGVRGSAGMEGRTHGKRPRPPPHARWEAGAAVPRCRRRRAHAREEEKKRIFSLLPARDPPRAAGGPAHLCGQLRAFQQQQYSYTLLELEFPRVLAPDWSSSRFSLLGLCGIHCKQGKPIRNTLLPCLVAASSHRWDWASCVPAASLGCGSRFSGSLSGIEPKIPRYP